MAERMWVYAGGNGSGEFLNVLPGDKARAAGELADEYEQAREREPGMRPRD